MPLPSQLVPLVTARPSPGLAASFASASSQSLSVASNSTLQVGANDMWVAGWFNLSSLSGARYLVTKWQNNGTDSSWMVEYNSLSANRFAFVCRNTANSASTSGAATTFGTPSVSTWVFIIAYHDNVNSQIGISVNGGAFDTASHSGGVRGGGAAVVVASLGGGAGYLGGNADSVAFGKSPPGGIAALATTIRARLYNGGRYLDLRRIPYGEWSSWGGVSAWPLHEGTGTRYDVWGNNHLTDNNGVTVAAGRA